MSYVSKTLTNAAIGVGVADDPASLDVIKKPGCAGVIWRRQMPLDVHDWLAAMDPAHLPKTRSVLQPDDVAGALGHLCDMAQTPVGPHRDWLEADIANLAGRFADLMSVNFVRVRLDAVTTNACRKFHIDALTARLICTYRGAGVRGSNGRADPVARYSLARDTGFRAAPPLTTH